MPKLIDVSTDTGGSSFAGMVPGETRTVLVARRLDSRGKVDPTSRTPKTITRTNRPFIFDWVDSSNDELVQCGRRDIRWVVDAMGDQRLVSAKEADRIARR